MLTRREVARGFEIARAPGGEFITASSTLSSAKRVVPFAEKHKMTMAMHNHSNGKDPNEFATPDSFSQNTWPIAAFLEYEYKGVGSPVEEVQKGHDYIRQGLV